MYIYMYIKHAYIHAMYIVLFAQVNVCHLVHSRSIHRHLYPWHFQCCFAASVNAAA